MTYRDQLKLNTENRTPNPMLLFRTWKLGIKSLLLHPMRSALTVLGIFIGVASVIWLLAIGEGISQEAQRQIEDLGAENIIVRSIQPPDESGGNFREIKAFGVKRAESEMIDRTISTVKRVLPIRELTQKFAYTGNPNVKPIDGRLVGCTPEYADVTRLVVESWPFSDAAGMRIQIVRLRDRGPVGRQTVSVRRSAEQADFPAGEERVLQNRWRSETSKCDCGHRWLIGGSGFFAGHLHSHHHDADCEWVTRKPNEPAVRFRSKVLSFPRSRFRSTTRTMFREPPNWSKPRCEPKIRNRQDIAVVVPYELLEQAKTTRLMFMMFMGLIAAISLIVGGIGIMNIMLATVTERTREIGIRRALGGKRSDITQQFLVETISLSVVGGLTGILGGLLCPAIVQGSRWLSPSLPPISIGNFPDVAQDHDTGNRADFHSGGVFHLGRRRRHVWSLPGHAGRPDGSDRSPSSRVKVHFSDWNHPPRWELSSLALLRLDGRAC